MRIDSLTLQNFRCFGPTPTTISLGDITALVGANGAGKTAVLQAVVRLFGVPPSERGIQRSDFHATLDVDPDEVNEVALMIEARLAFPELAGPRAQPAAVPGHFQHMIVNQPGGEPYCRVRLEATRTRGTLPEGDIEENVFWVTTSGTNVTDADKLRMRNPERNRIHAVYVPASRDPSKRLRYVSGTLLGRILRAIAWSEGAKQAVASASQQMRASFDGEAGIGIIHQKVGEVWGLLHDAAIYANPRLRPIADELEDVLKQIELVFRPGEDGAEHALERLSEGMRSLFYMALVGSVVEIEREAVVGAVPGGNPPPFAADRLVPPDLTFLAMEEPENHLAPQYLGRIMTLLKRLVATPAAQVALTTHSPSILRRVDPQAVRHLKLDPTTRATIVREIRLPAATDEAHKYVKEAVTAYPELYFARLVVLGEGDSEEIVLPRILKVGGARATAPRRRSSSRGTATCSSARVSPAPIFALCFRYRTRTLLRTCLRSWGGSPRA